MNIQEFYLQKANTNLNGSIISAVILLVILSFSLAFSWNLPLFLVTVPFLLVSLVHYNGFVLYKNKMEESAVPVPLYEDKELFELNSLLLTFAPAPALRVLFFTPDGMFAGEMRETRIRRYRWFIPYFADKRIRKRLGIYDSEGIMQASLIQERNRLKMFDQKGNVIGLFYPSKRKAGSIGIGFIGNGKKLRIDESTGLFHELKLIRDEGELSARLQKGWMPLEWTHYFKDANIPVLTFDYSLNQQERLVVFAALASRYMYYDH
ncbi:hypothetical protein [Mesobacillus jeotgali]|uniref:hypothetical protein n=1 Tax=Mesobacillus jeotgali TaxID=129985 RepID=UPI0009A574EB|nr:hypothetical protein [Mesobacillus jeotgali]